MGVYWCLTGVWWLLRVTLVAAFGFLPQNFGRRWKPTIVTLSFYETRFSGGDTQTLPYANEFV